MKSTRPDMFDILDSEGRYTAAFEAQFAQYIAGLQANLDDPADGEENRIQLAMDRDELRAVFALSCSLTNTDTNTDLPPGTVLATAVLTAVMLAVGVLLAAWCWR